MRIWEHVLTAPGAQLIYDEDTKRFDVKQIGANLFLTCHALALETLYLPLKLNTLCFTSKGFLGFWKRVSNVERKTGCRIEIKDVQIWDRKSMREEESDRSDSSGMESARSLEIKHYEDLVHT